MATRSRLRKTFRRAKGILPDSIEHTLDTGLVKTGGFFHEFREFAIKGNIIDLAIGIVIGAAFTSIVNSLVADIINPIIGGLGGNVDFSGYYINLTNQSYESLAAAEEAGAAIIRYGKFINAIINFLIVSLSMFLILRIVIKHQKKEDQKEEIKQEISTKKCIECFEDIKMEAKRCKFCTTEQPEEPVEDTLA